jgi:hypothetical protein
MTVPRTPSPTPVVPGGPRWLDQPTIAADPCVWIACDESGRDGDNLHGDAVVFCLGSVRITDDLAGPVVTELATLLGRRGELKWAKVPDPDKAEIVTRLLDRVHGAGGKVSFVVMHNPFAAVAKTVDLLIEEYFHVRKVDIYSDRFALQMAWFLFVQAPPALGTLWTDLLDVFISLHRRRHPAPQAAAGIDKATVEDLYTALDRALLAVGPGALKQHLDLLARTRPYAEHTQTILNDPDGGSLLDQHQPSIASTLRRWADPSLPVRLLHDDCPAVLREEMLDLLERMVADPGPDWEHLVAPVTLLPTAVGDSDVHPSLQLADIVAGAGREVGLWLDRGQPEDGVAEDLAALLLPMLDANQSVWKEPLPDICYVG